MIILHATLPLEVLSKMTIKATVSLFHADVA